jgi:hypothetical protein
MLFKLELGMDPFDDLLLIVIFLVKEVFLLVHMEGVLLSGTYAHDILAVLDATVELELDLLVNSYVQDVLTWLKQVLLSVRVLVFFTFFDDIPVAIDLMRLLE